MSRGHLSTSWEEVVKTVQEIRIWRDELNTWRGGVESRIDNLEKVQQHQQEKVHELESDALLVKEEQAEHAKKLISLAQHLERSCTNSIMVGGLIVLCLFSILLIIYKIIKNE